jgi:phospholipid transport system transporter-binding protein
MANTAQVGQEEHVIPCEEALDISTVSELRALLLPLLEQQQPVVLSAAQVTRVDTAALQVLSAFFQDARSRDLAVRWQEPSEAVQRAARLLDLTHTLGLDAEAQALDV